MKNPIQAMFEAGVVDLTDFPPESRYHGVPKTSFTRADGVEISFLRRRFARPPELFSTIRQRRVAQGERLDQIAAVEVGNPAAFWTLCDANGAIFAEELEVLGGAIDITLPEGLEPPEEDG